MESQSSRKLVVVSADIKSLTVPRRLNGLTQNSAMRRLNEQNIYVVKVHRTNLPEARYYVEFTRDRGVPDLDSPGMPLIVPDPELYAEEALVRIFVDYDDALFYSEHVAEYQNLDEGETKVVPMGLETLFQELSILDRKLHELTGYGVRIDVCEMSREWNEQPRSVVTVFTSKQERQ